MQYSPSYKHYENTASKYDATRFKSIAGRWNNNQQERIVVEMAKKWRIKKILEIGCGTGRSTKMLLNLGCKVTAIEPAISMLMEAKKRCKDDYLRGDVKFINTDIENLCCLKERYDVIILVNVFSRLPEIEQAIKKISDALFYDGELVFNFQCLASLFLPFAIIVNQRGKSLSNDVYSHWYKPSQIKSLLVKHDFQVQGWFGHYYVPVPRVLFWTLPVMWIANLIVNNRFAKLTPSLFVSCLKRAC